MSTAQLVAEASRRFPYQAGDADINLVISHKTRLRLNSSLNRKAIDNYKATHPKLPCAEIVAPANLKGKNQPQDYFLYVGQLLIGCSENTAKGIVNGAFYRVETITAEGSRLCDIDTGDYVQASYHTLERLLRLSHSVVYAQVQGRTFRSRVRLWDCQHPYFTKTHLLVGISRADSYQNVDLAPESPVEVEPPPAGADVTKGAK